MIFILARLALAILGLLSVEAVDTSFFDILATPELRPYFHRLIPSVVILGDRYSEKAKFMTRFMLGKFSGDE